MGTISKAALQILVLFLGVHLSAVAQIVRSFFGMQMNHEKILGEPWPVVPIGALRLWDAGVAWSNINTAPGQYDWSRFDAWLNYAQQNNVDVLYVFGRTPRWISSTPNDPGCANSPGECDPPNDLNADGSGTNQHFKDFVTAVVTRSAGRVHYWEVWDEAANKMRWTGSISQMLRLASDVRSIVKTADPSAVILSPSSGIRYPVNVNWMTSYLAAGGGDYADVISIHGYIQKSGVQPVPEDYITYLNTFKGILSTYGQSGKPIFDTEASWGLTTCCNLTDPDLQAGFAARFILVHASAQTGRLYWYEWNNITVGTLWLPDFTNLPAVGTLLKPGMAYQQVYNWLVGATLTQPCSAQGTVWTCNFSRPNGYLAQAVWDTSQTCSNGSCTSSSYKSPAGYINYSTIYGQTFPISGSNVPIGYQPILLANQ